jgi:hypothetical protein
MLQARRHAQQVVTNGRSALSVEFEDACNAAHKLIQSLTVVN